jgi:tetratricopeptide (TPR) repeat protein
LRRRKSVRVWARRYASGSTRAPGEGLRWSQALLALPGARERGQTRGLTLFYGAICAAPLGERRLAAAWFAEAAICFRVSEDLPRLCRAHAAQGLWAPPSQRAEALAAAQEALTLARAMGRPYFIANAEIQLGRTLFNHSIDLDLARVHLEEGLRLARALGADLLGGLPLGVLGTLAASQERFEDARRLFLEARLLGEATGDRITVVMNRAHLAALASVAGDPVQEMDEWRTALLLARELGNPTWIAVCLGGPAAALVEGGRAETAARLLAAVANGWRSAMERSTLTPIYQGWYARYQEALAATRAALSPDVFTAAWAEGQRLSLEQATSLAFEALSGPTV